LLFVFQAPKTPVFSGGEQWVAVLAAALLVHQLVPQQKNRKNITLYNIKSNWKDLASTSVQQWI